MGNTQATSQQYTNVLSTSTFYCPLGQTYCSIPKQAQVNFPFNINSDLKVSGTSNLYNLLVTNGFNAPNSFSDLYGVNLNLGGIKSKGPALIDGNVGIGTITPSSKLDVNGSVNIDGDLTLSNSITNPVLWTITQEPTTNNLCFKQIDTSTNITRTKFCLSGSGESDLWAYSREEANTPYFYANRDTTSANKKGRVGTFMGGYGFVGWNA